MAPKPDDDDDDRITIEWLDSPEDVVDGEDAVRITQRLAAALQEVLALTDLTDEEGE